ncbi:13132_t:CDS:2 [Entrophospora sp. SA101]|nr:13132_t:CDS:2 [Entrophospora sp. SA101]
MANTGILTLTKLIKAFDTFVKSLYAIINNSSDKNKIRKATNLLANTKNLRKKNRDIDNLWLEREYEIHGLQLQNKRAVLEVLQVNGIIDTVKQNQQFANILNKGAITNLESCELVDKNVSMSKKKLDKEDQSLEGYDFIFNMENEDLLTECIDEINLQEESILPSL